MAKTRTTGGEVGCIAVVALVLLLAVAGPIALAVWGVFCELRARTYRAARSIHDVLNPQEQAELDDAGARVDHFNDEIGRWIQHGLSAGYSRRADGMFDARRVKARDLNGLLESLYVSRAAAQLRYDDVHRRLGGRISRWVNANASLSGSRAALIAFVVVFVAVIATKGGELTLSTLLFGDPEAGSTRMMASFSAMAVAVVAMLIAHSTTRASLVS